MMPARPSLKRERQIRGEEWSRASGSTTGTKKKQAPCVRRDGTMFAALSEGLLRSREFGLRPHTLRRGGATAPGRSRGLEGRLDIQEARSAVGATGTKKATTGTKKNAGLRGARQFLLLRFGG